MILAGLVVRYMWPLWNRSVEPEGKIS
jgi:hypothetical protein